jgi:NADH-quinone oxidoreductase subunit N
MSFLAVAPEVVLTIGALLVLLVDITFSPRPRWWGIIAAVSLFVALLFAGVQWQEAVNGNDAGLYFSGTIALDGFAAFGGFALIVVAAVGLAAGWGLVERLPKRGAEFVALLLIVVAGFHLMAAAADFILLFLGLEVASISLYVMAGFTRERAKSDESALKYFLLGAFASAIFLYGIALFYAATGTTSLYEGGAYVRENVLLEPGVFLAAMGLLLVGLAFKVSAAPFHMWAPDVYQGAPGGIVGVMAATAKIGGFAALARILVVAVGSYVDEWAPAVAVVAAASVVIGTLLALVQTDMKRMLAYSSVAHAGFIMTALVAGVDGVPAMWFFVATYAIEVIAAFGVSAAVGGPTEGPQPLTDYAGLGERSPLLGQTMMVMMLAMAGIPLTAGFVGKIGAWQAALDADYLWLVIVGVLASVAGLFFYLRVIVLMYMQAPALAEAPGTATATPQAVPAARAALMFGIVATVLVGIIPWPLLNVVEDALPF